MRQIPNSKFQIPKKLQTPNPKTVPRPRWSLGFWNLFGIWILRFGISLGSGVWVLGFPSLALAHVGSPNVFFEGQAGPYPIRVIIRPPAVLPGTAQVDVRVDGATNITLQGALWETGTNGAPNPIAAIAVAGETNLFNAAVWLYFSGSYSVHVRVEGNRGGGAAIVPLSSTALRQPSMSPAMAAVLVALGIVLFVGAVWFVGAAATASSEGWNLRARGIAAIAALIFAGAIYAGKIRWQKMDGEFRNNALYKPIPMLANVRTNGNLRLLQLTPTAPTPNAPGWDALVADHGKLMHLFLLREPDFNAFAHLHPVRRDEQTFENILPPLPVGRYQLYAEVTHENGLNETLIASLTLPDPWGRAPQILLSSNMLNEVFCQSPFAIATNAAQPFALDADDSWHTGASASPSSATNAREARLMGGSKMIFQNAGDLVENRETSLRFVVVTPDGQPVPLQPYMGMAGHCVVRRSDGEVFTHLHPVGTISMAAQELFARRERNGSAPPPVSSNTLGNEVALTYAFPRAGAYRVWVQVRTNGRVLTGVFDLNVKPAR